MITAVNKMMSTVSLSNFREYVEQLKNHINQKH